LVYIYATTDCAIYTDILTLIKNDKSDAEHQTQSLKQKRSQRRDAEETDRHSKTNLLKTILYNRYKHAPSSLIGQALLRYGIAERLELRFLVEDGRQRDQYISETVQSIYPLALGTKIALLKDVKGLPNITLVSYLKLPFTSRSSEQKIYWSPSVLLAFEHKIGDKFKLEYNVGAQQDAYDTDWEMLGNLALHYKLTQKLELATEYYARYQPGENPSHNIGGSISYEIGNALEVYLSGGSTLYTEEQNHFFNGGVAFRLPKK